MPSSWLLSVGTLAVSSMVSPAVAHPWPGAGPHYELVENWVGKSFLDHTEFFTAKDPTNGFVNYLDQESAESSGLFKLNSGGSLYMGVDSETTLDPNGKGRDSVRIESKKFYDEGLYVVDIKHMPGSICGTWPAFWSVGPSWPQNGEIDIVEGVNMHNANEIVLHTSGSCGLSADAEMSGTMSSSECGDASGTIGCVVKGENGTSGTPFNEKGGGVYTMERTPHFIKLWYFPRDAVPESIKHGKPDVHTFGTPMANLQGSCDFKERFTAQKFVFNTDFCGDWAGGIYGEEGCPMSDPNDSFKSCHTFVAENPEKFKEAYWELNSVQIYQPGFHPHHASNEPSTATTAAANTASAVDTAPTTQVPPTSTVESTSDVESAATTAAAPQSSASSSTTAPEPSTDLPETHVQLSTSSTAPEPSTDLPETHVQLSTSSTASETSPAPATTAAPADNTPSSSEVHGVPAPASKPASKSTVYTTSTTTICDKAESSSAAAAFFGGKPGAHTNTPFGSEEHAPASLTPAPDRMGMAASDTPSSGNVAPQTTSSSVPAEPTAKSSAPASEPSQADPVPVVPATSEVSPAPTSTETPEAAPVTASPDVPQAAPASTEVSKAVHAPASSETIQAVPSRSPSSASLFGPGPTSSGPSSVAPTPSGSFFAGPGSASNSGPSGALFTGAANRVSVGTSGIICVLAAALLV